MEILITPIIVGAVIGGSLLAVAIILATIIRRFSPAPRLGGLYEAVPTLLTEAERSFFGVLQQALPGDYLLFAKVRLADVIAPSKILVGRPRYAAFNRICAKHIDFVLCERKTLRIVGLMELDDRSHSLHDRQERDRFVEEALAAAQIPLLRILARKFYSPVEIRDQIARMVRPQKDANTKATPSASVSL